MSTITITARAVKETAHERAGGTLFAADPDPLILDDNAAGALAREALFRFTDLRIPRGANITSVVLNVTPVDTSSDDPEVTISCEDIDDCPDLATLADVSQTRVPRKTTAETVWSATGVGAAEVASPDFKTSLQELVNRLTYELESAVGVLLVANSIGAKVFQLNDTANLTLTYTLLDAQNAIAVTSTSGVPFALAKKVVELTVQCDTGSAQPIQFKVPGIVDDFFELEAGQSIPVYIAPRAKETRDIFEVIFKVSGGTGTASYVTSGI